MASCNNSIVALTRPCGGVVAGIQNLYIVAFSDLSGVTQVYSATTGGTVISIGLKSGKKYVEVGLLKNVTGLNFKSAKDPTKGLMAYTHTVTTVLSDLTAANWQFIETVQNQPVSIILKSLQGNYYVSGLNGQFEVSNIEGGTGVNPTGDLIGANITFEGISTTSFSLVDTSIIASLIA